MRTRTIINGLGERLSRAIYDKDMTVTTVSRLSGVPRSSIYSYLDNQITPTLRNLYKLSEVLGVSVDWLVFGVEK